MNKLRYLICLFLIINMAYTKAQNSSIWQRSNDAEIFLQASNERKIIPQQYDVWKIDFTALKAHLDQAPLENTETATPFLFSIPMPNQKMVQFEVFESPIAHRDLMRKYPSFKTFSVVGFRQKEYFGRIDYTLDGFRASINTPEGEVYIDPYASEMPNACIVYFTKGYQRQGAENIPFRCGVEDGKGQHHIISTISSPQNNSYQRSVGTNVIIKKYRLAYGATGEFTVLNGGTKEKALTKMIAMLNRLNKLTLTEYSTSFELIAKTDTLIFLDPVTDPFPRGREGKVVVGQTHGVIVSIIGNNAFDIGHFMTSSCIDGVAGVAGGSVCTGGKGAGITCDNGNADLVAVNTIAHELGGHQFTGSHTMSTCTEEQNGQVGSSSRIEPGSGSTIMSYDGSCGSNNVTGQYWKTNGYYSVGTLGQAIRHISNYPNCGVKTTITNHNPVVEILNQKKGLTIPISTPFELRAKASDEDNDVLTYSWEQSDNGSNLDLGLQNTESNDFRVFDPTSSPNRTFPRLSNILANKSTKDELYPLVNRSYTFVCTVRDNNIKGVGLAMDTVLFRSTETAGPFAITYPNSAIDALNAGDYNVIKWNVANTDNKIVNCQQVNILLSTDGGNTFPIVLAQNTANDGEEGVIIPKTVNSSKVRIRINAADNIFFDISNRDAATAIPTKKGFNCAFSTEKQKYCVPEEGVFNIQTVGTEGYSEPINFSVDNLPKGAVVKFDATTIAPDENTRLTIDFSNVKEENDFNIRLRAVSGNDTIFRTIKVSTTLTDFSALATREPQNGATAVDVLPTLKWNPSPNADFYDVQVAKNPTFATDVLVSNLKNLKVSEITPTVTLLENSLYFWRIRASSCRNGEWTVPSPFHTLTQNCTEYLNDKITNISASSAATVNNDLEIPNNGIISDVNITSIKGQHGNLGQLEVRLISPDGKASLLSDKKCPAQGGLINLRYDDESPFVNKCDKSFLNGPVYRPDSPLSVFDGSNTKGKWSLQIKDLVAGDGGVIQSWGVRFCASASVKAPELIKNDTLKVKPNKGAFLNNSLLLAKDDKASAQQITYMLVTLPQHGIIEKWGGGILAVGATFNQAQIDEKNVIRYVHGNNTATSDYFLFVITDGEGGFLGTLRYNIVIDPNAQISNTYDIKYDNSISVFPNPTDKILNISMIENNTNNTVVELFDISGRKVLDRRLNEGELTIQLETNDLIPGMYMLKVSNAHSFASKRIVIQH
jgi:subtilisin-like proprotein convertase family protein